VIRDPWPAEERRKLLLAGSNLQCATDFLLEDLPIECVGRGPLQEGERVLLAGSKLSGKVPGKVGAEPERLPDRVGAGPKGRLVVVAEFQRGCYHNSTVPVKEYSEVIEKMGDRGMGRENRKVKMGNKNQAERSLQ
jgi:hypothetical protein